MAKLTYNYENITNYRKILADNKQVMQDNYSENESQLSNLYEIWKGTSGTVSENDLEELQSKYSGFLERVDSFIDILDVASREKSTAEQESAQTYNQ